MIKRNTKQMHDQTTVREKKFTALFKIKKKKNLKINCKKNLTFTSFASVPF